MDVKTLNEQIRKLQDMIKFIENNQISEGDSVETIIFKKYLELESTKKVTNYINELGYRKPTTNKQGIYERKYITTDISNTLKDKRVRVDKELKDFVIKLLNKNKGGGFN